MKVRIGFVSNSSSASFVVKKAVLSELQVRAIKEHMTVAQSLPFQLLLEAFDEEPDGFGYSACNPSDAWGITEDETSIRGETSMDNFDMHEFLKVIGVKRKDIEYEHNG